jgi:hypothetical protein
MAYQLNRVCLKCDTIRIYPLSRWIKRMQSVMILFGVIGFESGGLRPVLPIPRTLCEVSERGCGEPTRLPAESEGAWNMNFAAGVE